MKVESKGFVPLDQISVPKVRFISPVPGYVDQSQIGINVGNLNMLRWMAGINELVICGKGGEETTQASAVVIGANSQGGAYAGKVSERRASTFLLEPGKVSTDDVIKEGKLPWFANRAVDTTLNLNLDEIASRINKEPRWKEGSRSSEAWVYYLNKSLKEGIRNFGVDYLQNGLNSKELGIFHGLAVGSVLVGITSGLGGSFLNSLLNYAEINIILNSINMILFTAASLSKYFSDFFIAPYSSGFRNIHPENFRPSLIYGPQYDLALVLRVVSRTATIAKKMPVN